MSAVWPRRQDARGISCTSTPSPNGPTEPGSWLPKSVPQTLRKLVVSCCLAVVWLCLAEDMDEVLNALGSLPSRGCPRLKARPPNGVHPQDWPRELVHRCSQRKPSR